MKGGGYYKFNGEIESLDSNEYDSIGQHSPMSKPILSQPNNSNDKIWDPINLGSVGMPFLAFQLCQDWCWIWSCWLDPIYMVEVVLSIFSCNLEHPPSVSLLNKQGRIHSGANTIILLGSTCVQYVLGEVDTSHGDTIWMVVHFPNLLDKSWKCYMT